MASLLALLVDDDELSLEITGLQLAALGHAVVKATTGAQALEYLAEAARTAARLPDVVITDLHMPDMDGRALCGQIHQMGIEGPRIFAMSATRPNLKTPERHNLARATRTQGDELSDFDGFLLKPLGLDSLREALNPAVKPTMQPAVKPTMQPAVQPTAAPPKFPPSSVVQMPEPSLDATILQKLRVLMMPAALDELLTAFLADTRSRVSQLERFNNTGDQQALRSCAHMIKGSAAMTGASRVARIAAQLETGEISPERQKLLISELRCACDAIAGTLAREERINEAHDHQIPRIG